MKTKVQKLTELTIKKSAVEEEMDEALNSQKKPFQKQYIQLNKSIGKLGLTFTEDEFNMLDEVSNQGCDDYGLFIEECEIMKTTNLKDIF